jgi:hypothetical protein
MIRAIIAVACLTFGAAASAQDVPKILGTKPKEWRLSLPAAYQRELDRVAPGIAIVIERRYGEYPPVVDSASTPSVLIHDLNGDHQPEVFVTGLLGKEVVVVGLITSPNGITGKVLERRASYLDQILTVQKEHGRTWIRWQDDDCKADGLEFRVVGQNTTTRKSKCYYGE